jgi:breast cancer 2 susceptibility protein
MTRLLPDSEEEQNAGESELTLARDSIIPGIGFTSASDLVIPSVGFTSASALAGQPASVTRYGSSSPSNANPFEDYPQTVAENNSLGCLVDNPNNGPFSAFTSLGKQKNLFQPSAVAMRKAQERAKRWAVEDDDLILDHQDDSPEQIQDVPTPAQALQPVENVSPPGTSTGPTTSGLAIAQVEARGTFRSAACFSTPSAVGSRPFQTPTDLRIEGNAAMKPFKSPLLDPFASRNSLNLQSKPSLCNTITFTPTREPKTVGPLIGEVNTSGSRFLTPMYVNGTPMRKVPTKKFVTPFKPGMRPGEPGHKQLKARYDAEKVNAAAGLSSEGTSSISDGSGKPTRKRFFDLSTS